MKLLGNTSLHVGNEDLSNAQYKKKRRTRQKKISMCIEQVKTETNVSCLNTNFFFSKVKEFFSCVFMSSA
jgi:hypothetical protein